MDDDYIGRSSRRHSPTLAAFSIGMLGGFAAAFWRHRHIESINRELASRLEPGPGGIVHGAGPLTLPGRRGAAVLLVHGAADTPRTLRYTAAVLHRRGFTVHVPLLPGHGRSLEAFGRVTAADLMGAVREEYARLRESYDWVGVVGLSMGGALSVRLAAERADIPAMVLVAPYLVLPARAWLAARTARVWGPLVPAIRTRDNRSIHDPVERSTSLGYGLITPAGLRALEEVASAAWDALPRVTVPTLLIQSPSDNRISVDACNRGFERLGSPDKRLKWVEGCGHVITVDREHRRVNGAAAAWLEARAPRQEG